MKKKSEEVFKKKTKMVVFLWRANIFPIKKPREWTRVVGPATVSLGRIKGIISENGRLP